MLCLVQQGFFMHISEVLRFKYLLHISMLIARFQIFGSHNK